MLFDCLRMSQIDTYLQSLKAMISNLVLDQDNALKCFIFQDRPIASFLGNMIKLTNAFIKS